jgi:uncharacterized coiled-coil DUF342 family protein
MDIIKMTDMNQNKYNTRSEADKLKKELSDAKHKIKVLSDQLDIVEFWLQEIDTFYLSKQPEKNEFIRSKVHALINTINKLVVIE